MKKDANEFINKESLEFFGNVNASISHELKNILAIISETAGFLNDLTELAKRGENLELSMLENCSSNIAEEIERGFQTIRQMNRFAHSVDTFVAEVDPSEILDLVIKLSRFLSYAKPLEIDLPENPGKVRTAPFLLQNLIYRILCALYKSSESSEPIRIQLEASGGEEMTIRFSRSDQIETDSFFSPVMMNTADVLGIGLEFNGSPACINIRIPVMNKKIDILDKRF